MGFSISKAFKSVTKPFKKIAKKIKKVAGKVIGGIMKLPGFKQLGQLYAKTFGKLGPLGMIAASFILPGIGGLLAQGWGAAASALGASGSAFLQAVGSGMSAISTGLSTVSNFISQGFSAVSDKIGQAFTNIGGSISDGAGKMWSAASEWTKQNLPGTHANLSKMGDWVAQKAQSFGFGDTGGVGAPSSVSDRAASVLSQNPELRAAADAQARSQLGAITGAQKSQALLGPEATKFTFDPAQQAEIDTRFAQTPNLAKETVLKTTGEELASANVLGRNLSQTIPAGESFAKKALKAGATLLGGDPVLPPLEFATELPGIGDSFGTQRFGIGGTGATGGQFLTPQQLAFFQQHAQLIGQQG